MYENINLYSVIFLSFIIIISSIIIIFYVRFEKKQKNKYKECLKLIKEKENTFTANNTVIIENNDLMINLYNIYIEFINKINNNQKDFDNMLDGFIKDFYENKIDVQKSKKYFEIIDNINLNECSLLEYDELNLKFKIKISCIYYKKMNDQIISGSKYEPIEQINILTYIKKKDKWLINKIEKIYEKKLS